MPNLPFVDPSVEVSAGFPFVEIPVDLFSQIGGKENKSEKGAENGYAPLDGDGLLPIGNLPQHAHAILDVTGLPASLSGIESRAVAYAIALG